MARWDEDEDEGEGTRKESPRRKSTAEDVNWRTRDPRLL